MTMTVISQVPVLCQPHETLLVADELGKRYFGRDAVRGFSIELAGGSVHGLYGVIGSGKTTLARLLTGALAPDSGAVCCGGRPLDRLTARRFGVVANGSTLGLLPGRSAAANIYLGRERRVEGRLDLAAMADDASTLLRVVGAHGLDPFARLITLSAADRLLVECARVLATRSRVFVLDEPTLGLSTDEATRVHAALRAVADAGVAVLVLSSDLAELVENCDEVSLL